MEGTPPPPPPPAGEVSPPPSGKASAGLRALGVLGFLILAFASAVLIAAIVDIGNTPTCGDTAALNAKALANPGEKIECFDGSSTKKTITQILVWPGGVLAGIAALLALAFTVTGRNGRLVFAVVALAIVLSGLGLLIGSL